MNQEWGSFLEAKELEISELIFAAFVSKSQGTINYGISELKWDRVLTFSFTFEQDREAHTYVPPHY